MIRLKQMESFWGWLPHFRAVAEYQHLSKAAADLGVSRSSLSRSIRLLEEAVGTTLFDRVGRSLRLNMAGQQFLQALRDGMRMIHEGLLRLDSDGLAGPFKISCAGVFHHIIRPALSALAARYPSFIAELSFSSPELVGERLLSGDLDLAIVSLPQIPENLSLELLAVFSHSVYCGPGHPLFGNKAVSVANILEHSFVVPGTGRNTADQWPPSLDRRVGMRIHQLSLAMEICLDGKFLAVLPDSAVNSHAKTDSFFRLPFELLQPVKVFAAKRKDLRPDMDASLVLKVIREHLQ